MALDDCTFYELPGECGRSICLRQFGGPFQHSWKTPDDYTLCIRMDAAGDVGYTFAEPSEDGMQCSQEVLKCGSEVPSFDVAKRVMPRPIVSEADQREGDEHSLFQQALKLRVASSASTREADDAEHRRFLQSKARIENLVLMIRFRDHKEKRLPSLDDFDVLFNNDGPHSELAPTGSVSDAFDANLYGAFDVDNVLVGWVDVSITEREAAGEIQSDGTACQALCRSSRLREAIVEALETVERDGRVDMSKLDADGDGFVDMFSVIHSGFGAEVGGSGNVHRIWAHKWVLPTTYVSRRGSKRIRNYNISPGLWGSSGTAITRLAVIVHESFHFLGLPDLYDTDYTSRGAGNYDVMANSWGYDGSQLYPGSLSAWSKYVLGVVTPVRVTTPGRITLDPVQISGQGTVAMLEYTYRGAVDSNEFLLIENRQATGFDRLAPGGLLVWHIDMAAATNNNEGIPGVADWPRTRYKVALLQADGRFDLELNRNNGDSGDWFRAGSSLLSDTTMPSLNSYRLMRSGVCSGHVLAGFRNAGGGSISFTYSIADQSCSGVISNTRRPTPVPTTALRSSGSPGGAEGNAPFDTVGAKIAVVSLGFACVVLVATTVFLGLRVQNKNAVTRFNDNRTNEVQRSTVRNTATGSLSVPNQTLGYTLHISASQASKSLEADSVPRTVKSRNNDDAAQQNDDDDDDDDDVNSAREADKSKNRRRRTLKSKRFYAAGALPRRPTNDGNADPSDEDHDDSDDEGATHNI